MGAWLLARRRRGRFGRRCVRACMVGVSVGVSRHGGRAPRRARAATAASLLRPGLARGDASVARWERWSVCRCCPTLSVLCRGRTCLKNRQRGPETAQFSSCTRIHLRLLPSGAFPLRIRAHSIPEQPSRHQTQHTHKRPPQGNSPAPSKQHQPPASSRPHPPPMRMVTYSPSSADMYSVSEPSMASQPRAVAASSKRRAACAGPT